MQLIASLRVQAHNSTAPTQGSPDTGLMIQAHAIRHPTLLAHPQGLDFPAAQKSLSLDFLNIGVLLYWLCTVFG